MRCGKLGREADAADMDCGSNLRAPERRRRLFQELARIDITGSPNKRLCPRHGMTMVDLHLVDLIAPGLEE